MRGRRFHLRFLGIAGALAGLWWAGSRLVAPRLIRAAWEERSLRILNDLLEGRSRHPLDDYLASWQTFVDRVEPVLVVGLLLTWAVLAFRVPDRIRAWNARLVERERASRPPKTLTPGEGLSVAVFFGLGAGVAAAAYMLVSNQSSFALLGGVGPPLRGGRAGRARRGVR